MLSHAAVLPHTKSGEHATLKNEHGQARTLGLVTQGANLAGGAISTIGKVALALVGFTAAVKPLIVLGLGKCEYIENIIYLLEIKLLLYFKG